MLSDKEGSCCHLTKLSKKSGQIGSNWIKSDGIWWEFHENWWNWFESEQFQSISNPKSLLDSNCQRCFNRTEMALNWAKWMKFDVEWWGLLKSD